MPVPSRDSRTGPLTAEVNALLGLLSAARRLAVQQQATLSSDAAISHIVDNIYIPFVQTNGFWDTLKRVRALPGFNAAYLIEVGLRFTFGPAHVSPAPNRINLEGNGFAVDDPVRFIEKDVLPTPFVEGTTYFVLDKPTANTIRLAATVQGAVIDITADPVGSNVIRFGIGGPLNTLETAMEAVIDEIILAVPVTTTTLELRTHTFDKALASSTDGLADTVLTPAQTASIRAELLNVQNAIEAPV